MESALSLILWTSMVMRWLPDEEAVKTLFEKFSFTVDIRCDLISYQMLGEAYEIAAQDHKAFDDLSSLSCLTRVMVLPFLEWMWRISIQGLLSAFKLSSVQLSCTSPRCWKKKWFTPVWLETPQCSYFVLLSCEQKQLGQKNTTFYTKEYSCTVNKLLLMFSITFNNN